MLTYAGETAVAEGVAFGKWRVYRFQTDRWGIATVTLKQHSGTFGLRLLVQRETLRMLTYADVC